MGDIMAEPQTTEPVGDVDDAASLSPEQLGFMCGIEVHQQLATGKLHSRQPGVLSVSYTHLRAHET